MSELFIRLSTHSFGWADLSCFAYPSIHWVYSKCLTQSMQCMPLSTNCVIQGHIHNHNRMYPSNALYAATASCCSQNHPNVWYRVFADLTHPSPRWGSPAIQLAGTLYHISAPALVAALSPLLLCLPPLICVCPHSCCAALPTEKRL